jgi:hypothetical protein
MYVCVSTLHATEDETGILLKSKVRRLICVCSILLCVIQNSIFVSVNTAVQVKIITKVIYFCVNHDMFRPLVGYHQVYLYVLS